MPVAHRRSFTDSRHKIGSALLFGIFIFCSVGLFGLDLHMPNSYPSRVMLRMQSSSAPFPILPGLPPFTVQRVSKLNNLFFLFLFTPSPPSLCTETHTPAHVHSSLDACPFVLILLMPFVPIIASSVIISFSLSLFLTHTHTRSSSFSYILFCLFFFFVFFFFHISCDTLVCIRLHIFAFRKNGLFHAPASSLSNQHQLVI